MSRQDKLHLIIFVCCVLCLSAGATPAAHAFAQDGKRPAAPLSSAGFPLVEWISKRFLLDSNATSSGVSPAAGSAAAAPASRATILQAADVTFRLVGNDALLFSNATAKVFQQALHDVFSNFSYAAFEYQSSKVDSLFIALRAHVILHIHIYSFLRPTYHFPTVTCFWTKLCLSET